ncbi:MAG TPA: aldehyde dehydrogenase family protein [Terriglobales bacterium]|nr:aldehyde dehydrogenase family protein [Terriglobales bacterium]
MGTTTTTTTTKVHLSSRSITDAERETAAVLLQRARQAMQDIASLDQAAVDRLCRAITWVTSNETVAQRLANMSVDETQMGGREPSRRLKALGILRDALRQKSMGVIEEIPEKGIVKYGKPAGVVAVLIPVTSPVVTPIGSAIYALKCKDAVIFCPHPASKKTTGEVIRLLRKALEREGINPDVFQCVEKPSVPLTQALMSICDLTVATGGQNMVRAAYSSGKPAYGVGAGNATIVVDETADISEAARMIRTSKTNDNGSGCSADGNLLADSRIYDALRSALQKEGGYLLNDKEAQQLQAVYWDAGGHRTAATIARPAAVIAELAGLALPEGKTFLLVEAREIGKQHLFSTEKLGPVLAMFRFEGFDQGLDKLRQIFDTGGKGHSCGIYSHDDEHIHRLALAAPVSRMMVRQVQSKSNAGTFTNGMPMTSSMGCGIWGGNITNENISLKHYMNVTWVSRPIPEDRPPDSELFGEFYNTEIF